MRTTPAYRHNAEKVLKDEGWISINISKDFTRAEPTQYHDMCKWCEDTIGAGQLEPGPNWLDEDDVWYSFTWYGFWSFHFKHNVDATAFSLRWAG